MATLFYWCSKVDVFPRITVVQSAGEKMTMNCIPAAYESSRWTDPKRNGDCACFQSKLCNLDHREAALLAARTANP